MSEISRLATAFEKRSTEQAESTEKAVQSAFREHENALKAALNESEQRTSNAIRAQSRRLQRTALKSWLAVTLTIAMSLLLAGAIMGAMGWHIKNQIEDINRHQQTLEKLKEEGGSIKLDRCGESSRLCAKIDQDSPTFEKGYQVLEGY